MLAMDSKTPLGVRRPALSLTTIASMLAPTGELSFTHRRVLAKLMANSYNSRHGQCAFPAPGVLSGLYVVVLRAPQDTGFYQ